MKKLLILSICTFNLSFLVSAQNISTIAGNHAYGHGYSGDGGAATAAELYNPTGVAVDKTGNIYVADQDNNIIRKINTSGTISTIAGNHSFGHGYSGDGSPATGAQLYLPSAAAVDASGNVYIADLNNNVIRKVNTSGIISTIAGNFSYGAGYSGDGGAATAAELDAPTGVAVDASGNVYVADETNNVIRKINTSGIISTYAGNHKGGYSGDGGAATAAELYLPDGIGFDGSGNLYIADNNNYVTRKVNTLGIISTVAGNHSYGPGYTGDGGAATSAELGFPLGVCADASGNFYVGDENNGVRKVNTSGIISTYAGNHSLGFGYSGDGGPATAAELNVPAGVVLDAVGNLYIADQNNNVIRKVRVPCSLGNVSATATQNVLCNGDNNGNATVTFTGGISPYTYSWSSGSTSVATGSTLSPGTYTVVIVDSYGCVQTSNVTITQPAVLSYQSTAINDTGGCNGFAKITMSGGTAPYTYSWTPGGAMTDSIIELCKGTYCCNIIDANGCTQSTCVTITSTAGINTISNNSPGISIYPNPTTGKFTVTISNTGLVSVSQPVIEIYNAIGQRVSVESLNQVKGDNVINMSSKPEGIYFYRVTGLNGSLIGEGKLVFER